MGIGTSKPVQLRQILVTQDASGRNVESTGEVVNTWAEISSPSGSRDYLNGQTLLGSTRKFLVRFRFDSYPNSEWKIRYSGKDWTISDIQKVDEKRFYWMITATSKSDV